MLKSEIYPLLVILVVCGASKQIFKRLSINLSCSSAAYNLQYTASQHDPQLELIDHDRLIGYCCCPTN